MSSFFAGKEAEQKAAEMEGAEYGRAAYRHDLAPGFQSLQDLRRRAKDRSFDD
jgi:hypothetical protein